jgi:deoxyribonuclease-1-like protein
MNWIYLSLSIILIISGCNREAVYADKSTSVASASAIEVSPDICPKDAKTLISWNVMNFGSKKSDETITLMSQILTSRGLAYKDQHKIQADIVLLQEVNAGARTGGAQGVSRLQDALGKDWDSIVSDATSGDGTERYAVLWKKGDLSISRREAKLVADLADSVDREPYGAHVTWGKQDFWVYSFHAVPTAKNPIREVKSLASSGELASRENTILTGDFNLGRITIENIFETWQHHIDGRTSLKVKLGKNGEHLLYQYDHILTRGRVRVCESGIIDYVSTHYSPITDESLKTAHDTVSDHLPVYIRFTIE